MFIRLLNKRRKNQKKSVDASEQAVIASDSIASATDNLSSGAQDLKNEVGKLGAGS